MAGRPSIRKMTEASDGHDRSASYLFVLFLLTAIMLVRPLERPRRSHRHQRPYPSLEPVLTEILLIRPRRTQSRRGSVPRRDLLVCLRCVDSPYFPGTWCCEAGMVSFAVTGHPLEDTWGAIYSSDAFWSPNDDNDPPGPTAPVSSISPVFDGFLVVSQPGTGQIRGGLHAVASPALAATGFSPTLAG